MFFSLWNVKKAHLTHKKLLSTFFSQAQFKWEAFKMLKKTVLTVASLGALIGCVGSTSGDAVGGGTSPSTPTPRNGFYSPPEAVASFQDGGGTLKAAYNPNFIAITDDLAGFVSNLQADEIANISASGLSDETQGWPLSNLASSYGGTIRLAGNDYTGSFIIPHNGETKALFIFDDNMEFVSGAIWGPRVSEIPAGSFQYSGINLVALRNVSVMQIDGFGNYEPFYTGTGQFEMAVDFVNETGSISATTVNINNTGLTGTFLVDNETGQFSGDNLALSGTLGDVDLSGKTASIFGQFHGSGATGVSGVYHSNDETVGGAIMGSMD